MKNRYVMWNSNWLSALAVAAVAVVAPTPANAAEEEIIETRVVSEPDEPGATKPEKREHRIIIQKIEKGDASDQEGRKVSWLGVGAEEISEALASQLELNQGEGLTVTYVSPKSPAAKAGLQKNDVLVELDGQLLVHPAQLRKLIQKHKEGDRVDIVLYRAGKKETVAATIGTTKEGLSLLEEKQIILRDLPEVGRHLQELRLDDDAPGQLKQLMLSLRHAGVDREAISQEVKRSMEDVRKALQEALRQATNAHRTFGPAAREFRELARRGLDVEKDATVVVKSKRHSVRTIVKTDEGGTYVVVADPKKQLTAHDKKGKPLFDGPIETEEQRDKVPAEVWKKVKPMLEQLSEEKAALPEPEADPEPEAEDEGI